MQCVAAALIKFKWDKRKEKHLLFSSLSHTLTDLLNLCFSQSRCFHYSGTDCFSFIFLLLCSVLSLCRSAVLLSIKDVFCEEWQIGADEKMNKRRDESRSCMCFRMCVCTLCVQQRYRDGDADCLPRVEARRGFPETANPLSLTHTHTTFDSECSCMKLMWKSAISSTWDVCERQTSESVGITEAWSIIIVTVCFMCKHSYLFTKITFSVPEKIWFPHKGSQTRRSDADFLVLSPDRFSCKARVVGDVITMGVWLTDLWYMLNDR